MLASPRLRTLRTVLESASRSALGLVRGSALSVSGAILVSCGIGMIYRPAGVIAAGVFVLWIDRQTAS